MKKRTTVAISVGIITGIALLPNKSKAQDTSKSFHIGAEYDYLYSTHSTKFRGPTLLAEKDLDKYWAVGLGVGYNTCPFHPDNGYDLKDFQLVPVFASLRYTFGRNRLFDPYALFKTGITFMGYDRKEGKTDAPYMRVNELGWYDYIGGGSTVNLDKRVQLYLNVGLIGYKMSFNDLDINPHGVAGNIGFRVKI